MISHRFFGFVLGVLNARARVCSGMQGFVVFQALQSRLQFFKRAIGWLLHHPPQNRLTPANTCPTFRNPSRHPPWLVLAPCRGGGHHAISGACFGINAPRPGAWVAIRCDLRSCCAALTGFGNGADLSQHVCSRLSVGFQCLSVGFQWLSMGFHKAFSRLSVLPGFQ